MNKKSFLLIAYSLQLIAFLSGCATTSAVYMPPKIEQPAAPGVYHKVEKGQTLWRIARFYEINVEDLVKVNRIPDAAQIAVGQLLFIPQSEQTKPAVSLKTSDFDTSDFIWPARGKVKSFYGYKKDGVPNKGIDIAVKEDTDVVASRAGRVVFCDTRLKGFGNTIIVDHFDGFSTVYAYNSKALVKVDDTVKKGQVIAKSGSSGRAWGSCLHFEIRKGDKPQNPFYYLPR